MTKEEALIITAEWNLVAEIQYELDNGASPEEALYEWDIL